jgi:hypothetical protein
MRGPRGGVTEASQSIALGWRALTTNQFVFGYGSLVPDLGLGDDSLARACRLTDHRRVWDVAMDNSVTLPDYKHYLDARDGSRPDVLVTFLNLRRAPGHSVNGVLIAVDEARLRTLDRRERNYERREVTSAIEPPCGGRAWTYFGRSEACLRFADGARTGRAVVDRSYLDGVRAGFAALGTEALSAFDASTDAHGCHVLELLRVELD